ncbi:MAG: hypothetical protein IT444_10455 [Phycisphaeraceae bacterium]|nr:hypothetical protein [Phycisphaeraceae bacterium]
MAAKPRTPKRRSDCFFGLHFDLHPHKDDRDLGRNVTTDLVRRIIRAARPDYLQYDCKGHVGYMGYPDSKVSTSAGGPGSKGIINDSLAIYRRVTAEAGISLFVHFSGIWDNVACLDHPEWQAVNHDAAKPHEGITHVFSDYVTKRMIPQMKEVVDRYNVDGFWVDGDCWSVRLDYSQPTIERFRAATGLSQAPIQPGDPGWVEWCNLHREGFFDYVRTYMDALHAYKPGEARIQIASNWLYTPTCPEPIKSDIDFISGDYAPTDSVNSGRWNGRYMASTGLPWDLMAWAFVSNTHQGHQYKPAVQLQQEAAVVIALGGGFQMYFHQDRHGGFADYHINVMKEVGAFCRERRDVCFKTETVPQIALVLDTTSLFKNTPQCYAPCAGDYERIQGIMIQTLDAGHSVDVLADHHLAGQYDRWPVIIIPDWEFLPSGLVTELVEYARRGGSLVLTGAQTCRLFRQHLGVELDGDAVEQRRILQGRNGGFVSDGPSTAITGRWQKIKPSAGTKVIAWSSPDWAATTDLQPAVTIAPLGRGRIAGVFGPLAESCFHNRAPWTRDLIDYLLRRLYTPTVTMRGGGSRGLVDLVVRQKGDRLIINLCNLSRQRYSSPHYLLVDAIPPVGPIELAIRRDGRPRRITLEPGGKRLAFKWNKGTATVTVPEVHIHAVVVVE